MASGVYNRFFYNLAKGDVHWDTDNIKVALLGDSYTFDAGHNVWDTDSSSYQGPKLFEIANGNGYTTGGSSLDNCAVSQDDTAAWAKLDADDEVWSGATINTWGAVVYDDTLSSDDNICYFDFAAQKSVSTGSLTLQWSTNGLMTIAESS